LYRPVGEPEDLGLRFGRSRRFEDVSLATFERLQRKLGVDRSEASLADEVSGLVSRVKSEWPRVMEALEHVEFLRGAIGDSIALRAKTLLQR
jgi:serine/threonine-protein kinase HipA